MSDEQLRAQRYRMRAQEFRAIAKLDRKTQNHKTLLEIARRYDQMAQRLEASDQRQKNLKKIA